MAALLLAVLLAGCLAPGPAAPASGVAGASASRSAASNDRDPRSGLPVVAASALPRQAQQTLEAIRRGGPFPYSQDGAVFGNFERILPSRPRGHYREYTVRTPGESDRGARRIIAGADGERYWTADHYASFRVVREDR
ncbi:ribonuclease domain-containing protein [Tersicoccus sp. Bi-70]|uniref:ribonuclease domain-containing protein n=1 Tax=Tersicoccus sp. Bi-70 TaxID=1897634 RepID=UPI001E5A2F9A|nr:ribonuclease domain-containing protein [Tersicoccus sp. Bi-70]